MFRRKINLLLITAVLIALSIAALAPVRAQAQKLSAAAPREGRFLTLFRVQPCGM